MNEDEIIKYLLSCLEYTHLNTLFDKLPKKSKNIVKLKKTSSNLQKNLIIVELMSYSKKYQTIENLSSGQYHFLIENQPIKFELLDLSTADKFLKQLTELPKNSINKGFYVILYLLENKKLGTLTDFFEDNQSFKKFVSFFESLSKGDLNNDKSKTVDKQISRSDELNKYKVENEKLKAEIKKSNLYKRQNRKQVKELENELVNLKQKYEKAMFQMKINYDKRIESIEEEWAIKCEGKLDEVKQKFRQDLDSQKFNERMKRKQQALLHKEEVSKYKNEIMNLENTIVKQKNEQSNTASENTDLTLSIGAVSKSCDFETSLIRKSISNSESIPIRPQVKFQENGMQKGVLLLVGKTNIPEIQSKASQNLNIEEEINNKIYNEVWLLSSSYTDKEIRNIKKITRKSGKTYKEYQNVEKLLKEVN